MTAAVRRVDTLNHDWKYQAPSGRLCTLSPTSPGTRLAPQALMLYCHADGTPAHSSTQDGFTLSRFNWYLLRAVG